MADKKYIKKIVLDDQSTYYIYDAEAPRVTDLNNYVPIAGGEITGNLEVDQLIRAGSLNVQSIEYSEQGAPDNVLVQAANGDIVKRDINNLLADIGGISYHMDTTNNRLQFKIGRFTGE